MQASNSQADELPARCTDAEAQSACNVPYWFKMLPGELQDTVLRYVLCVFCQPETSDPANNGIYIEKKGWLALMPWRIDTRILDHPDKDIRERARRVMLVDNKLVYIKSESVNLRPIFHAAQVPIVTMSNWRFARSRVGELSKYFFLTHQIERLGGPNSSITSTSKPWGRTPLSLDRLLLTGPLVPRVQEFVILREDLDLFCRALQGADSGYYRFGECTRHTLTFHSPLNDLLKEEIPDVRPSRFAMPYRENLRGFTSFTAQGRIALSLALTMGMEVGAEIATPQSNAVIGNITRQMSQGDEQLRLDRPSRAAHIYARAAQELVVLYSKGVLPGLADSTPVPRLAELCFLLSQRQAQAWVAVMRETKEAAGDSAPRYGPHDAQADGHILGHRLYHDKILKLLGLVYDSAILIVRPPPPLRYTPTAHEFAMLLYHMVQADRLSNTASWRTRGKIQRALRVDPDDAEIRREAELIEKRFKPWTLEWIPE